MGPGTLECVLSAPKEHTLRLRDILRVYRAEH